MKILRGNSSVRRSNFAYAIFTLLCVLGGAAARCGASENPRLVVRDGQRLVCTVRFANTQSGDCGTSSYDAVFTGKILTIKQMPGVSAQYIPQSLKATSPHDLLLTVEPETVFKGHPTHEVQILASQGECFDVVHAGEDWLFFATRNKKTSALEISYLYSNPSGPVEQRRAYVDRLRRLARGDGLGYVVGEVGYDSFDLTKGEIFNPQPNHRVILKGNGEGQDYTLTTDAQGNFELGPVAPGFLTIDANTDSRFRATWSDVLGGLSEPNGCDFVRIDLEINSEISGRVILPDGYQYEKSEILNVFPLSYVDVYTLDGKQAGGTSLGDGLKFTVRGLPPGTYILQLANYLGESWVKTPVYAPGVTDKTTALQIDLGFADHKTDLEIRVPPEALKASQ